MKLIIDAIYVETILQLTSALLQEGVEPFFLLN